MSNLNEPMLPANEAMREIDYPTRSERLQCQDAVAVAADPEAMKAVLKEHIVLLMFQFGEGYTVPYNRLLFAAEEAAKKEYRSAPIVKGGACG